ncbi:MAG: adaptor protein MecA [Clostridia bacterium]|nr:adaptor protein MecA [Clostridia bacterium]
MTVSDYSNKKRQYKPTKEHLFIFPDSESMITSILFLYRHKYNFKSMLYKTENDYRLIIKCKRIKAPLLCLNEFCKRHSSNIIEAAFTKEYGKLLISKNTIKTIGKYFFKET